MFTKDFDSLALKIEIRIHITQYEKISQFEQKICKTKFSVVMFDMKSILYFTWNVNASQ